LEIENLNHLGLVAALVDVVEFVCLSQGKVFWLESVSITTVIFRSDLGGIGMPPPQLEG